MSLEVDLQGTPSYDAMDDINLEDEKKEEAPEVVTPVKEESAKEETTSTDPDFAAAPMGTFLEAAFVDPAYTWPPPDGEGKNAIELQASLALLNEEGSVATTRSLEETMIMPEKPKKQPWWKCCRSADSDVVAIHSYEQRKAKALTARANQKAKRRAQERARRDRERFQQVPEGILVYRLDTSTHTLTLVSQPHSKTNLDQIVQEMVIAKASPAADKSRRGIHLVGDDGTEATLVACEQRTTISWLEAMDMMLANENRGSSRGFLKNLSPGRSPSRKWADSNKDGKEMDQIEGEYLDLANYSNKLIRAGAVPGQKKGGGGAGGVYYNVELQRGTGEVPDDEAALEAIAKRRAVIKDSWDFYRMICSLLRDRRKYDEVFRKMQLDPVYPYLNSMTGLNDPGETGYENEDKLVLQKDLPEYASMSKMEVCKALIAKAEAAMPSLVEICKALAGSLGMEEVGVGPVKEAQAALRKAEKKYDGDLLKVTDYCRALLVVKDFPALLALLELARDSFGPLIRRVKMCTLKSDHKAKPGGYRDCIINVELKDHVAEIQIHLWPMWVVCGVDGFRHYRHCLEYSTDSFGDPYDALEGLDRKTLAELIVMAEEAVAPVPLDGLEWYQEKHILDYFAEVGLFLKHGLDVFAEITLRHLIKLRTESPDIGPDHHETMTLYRYLEEALLAQGKKKEAQEIANRLAQSETKQTDEKEEAEKSLWDCCIAAPTDAYEMIMDPNKKEREEEEKLRKEVKASKRQWRRIRHERFRFLDATAGARERSMASSVDNKSKFTEMEGSSAAVL